MRRYNLCAKTIPYGRERKGTIEIQTFGFTTDNVLLCAGVYFVPAISAQILFRIASHWRRWRKWYDSLPENKRESYTKGDDMRLAVYGCHPMHKPEIRTYIQLNPQNTPTL